MTSPQTARDAVKDHLLTPQNAALVVIDYQPIQVSSIQSHDRHVLVAKIVMVARIAKLFDLPVVLSTVNVSNGRNKPTITRITDVLTNVTPIDRTSMNSWEDAEFVNAVNATKRKKLIMTALWTEVCLCFPALDAMREGYEVYPVVDAVAGTSLAAHNAGLERIIQAGAQPITCVQLACELQRDWQREKTAKEFADILFAP